MKIKRQSYQQKYNEQRRIKNKKWALVAKKKE